MSEVSVHEVRLMVTPETTSEERTWAALAHISAVLTLAVSFASFGLGAVPFVFVPLVIYLIYREKSRYVAFHAAQAFALQVVGTVGYFVFMILATILTGLILALGALLLVILVGLIVLLAGALTAGLVALAYPTIPLLLGGLSVMATIETANGRDYRYPYLGRWVAEWLAKHETPAPPKV